MNWAHSLQWLCVGFAAFCVLVTVRPKKRNRRLPTPRADDRDTLRFWRNSWKQ